MSRTESWKVWLGIFALLIFSGLMAAFWPAISENVFSAMGSPGSGGGLSVPAETVTLPFPGRPEGIALTSWQILLGLSFLVIGVTVVTGIVLGFANYIISRWIMRTKTDEEYIEGLTVLNQREATELAAENAAHPVHESQQNDYSRWAVMATSAAILFFSIVIGYMVSNSLFPSGSIVNEDEIINITAIITGAFFLLTLIYLLIRMDRERLSEINARASAGIPWDAIAVLLLGALIVGLGVGVMIYINLPG